MHPPNTSTVLITGAATAAGSAIALAFATKGYQRIYLGDTSAAKLQSCREAILSHHPSATVQAQAFDRADEAAVTQFFAGAVEALGRIDCAVNVVSQAQDPDTSIPTGLSVEGFDRHFRIYQRGAFMIQRALLRQMLSQNVSPGSDCRGSIVNVVDHGPTPTLADVPVVAAVAFAIVGFSRTDACDYAADKIRINCVAAAEALVPKTKPELGGGVPLRKGRVEDVANAALWLSEPGSDWITGVVMPVDGGRSLHHWW